VPTSVTGKSAPRKKEVGGLAGNLAGRSEGNVVVRGLGKVSAGVCGEEKGENGPRATSRSRAALSCSAMDGLAGRAEVG
jgi:hypothetical protein